MFGLPNGLDRELGCAQDHLLIANCLAFIDTEAHVTVLKLSPNILYYLSTLFSLLENKNYKQKGHPSLAVNEASKEKQSTDDKENEPSAYTSLSQDHDSEADGSLSTNPKTYWRQDRYFCQS